VLKDLAFNEQVGTVADGEGFRHVVVGNEDTDILVFEFGYNSLYVLNGNGVNTGKRFIEQDELRIYCQGAGNLGTPVRPR
jgi:hypothetical protein